MSATERARVLIEGWDTYGEELRFVENADGTCVHVVAGSGKPRWADNEERAEPGSGARAFGLTVEEILDLEMGGRLHGVRSAYPLQPGRSGRGRPKRHRVSG